MWMIENNWFFFVIIFIMYIVVCFEFLNEVYYREVIMKCMLRIEFFVLILLVFISESLYFFKIVDL